MRVSASVDAQRRDMGMRVQAVVTCNACKV